MTQSKTFKIENTGKQTFCRTCELQLSLAIIRGFAIDRRRAQKKLNKEQNEIRKKEANDKDKSSRRR